MDAEIEDELDVPSEALSMDRIMRGLGSRGDSAVNLIVLDACRNNPYKTSSQRAIGDKGLARVSAPSGSLILYATKPGETASDNPGGRNGLFTKHLLNAIGQPGLQVEEAFKQVAHNVWNESGRKQYPWQEGSILGRFYFSPNHPPVPVPAPPRPVSLTGHLQVNVNVGNAEVRVKGRKVGTAAPGRPLNLPNQSLGALEVEVRANGYQSQKKRLKISRNQWNQAVFTLAPVTSPVAPPPMEPPAVLPRRAFEPEMVKIFGGSFRMGSESGDDDEKPVHGVRVSTFELGKYEVTVGQFRKFIESSGYKTDAEKNAGDNKGCRVYKGSKGFVWKARTSWRDPGFSQGEEEPVVCVSHNDAEAYISWLNGAGKGGYRLPTEAEWEYAARAGSTGKYSYGESEEALCDYGNGADVSLKSKIPDWKWQTNSCKDGYVYTAPVGQFRRLMGLG